MLFVRRPGLNIYQARYAFTQLRRIPGGFHLDEIYAIYSDIYCKSDSVSAKGLVMIGEAIIELHSLHDMKNDQNIRLVINTISDYMSREKSDEVSNLQRIHNNLLELIDSHTEK